MCEDNVKLNFKISDFSCSGVKWFMIMSHNWFTIRGDKSFGSDCHPYRTPKFWLLYLLVLCLGNGELRD
jgi:hypothetical protein